MIFVAILRIFQMSLHNSCCDALIYVPFVRSALIYIVAPPAKRHLNALRFVNTTMKAC